MKLHLNHTEPIRTYPIHTEHIHSIPGGHVKGFIQIEKKKTTTTQQLEILSRSTRTTPKSDRIPHKTHPNHVEHCRKPIQMSQNPRKPSLIHKTNKEPDQISHNYERTHLNYKFKSRITQRTHVNLREPNQLSEPDQNNPNHTNDFWSVLSRQKHLPNKYT